MTVHGVSRKELQEKYGVSHTTVQNWEKRGWLRPFGFERGVAVYDPEEVELFDPDNPPEGSEVLAQNADPQTITIAELIRALKNNQEHLASVVKVVVGPGAEMLKTYGETVKHALDQSNSAQEKVKDMWEAQLKMTQEHMLMQVEAERDERAQTRKDLLLQGMMQQVLPRVVEHFAKRHGLTSPPTPQQTQTAARAISEDIMRSIQLLGRLVPTITDDQVKVLEGSGVLSPELVAFVKEARTRVQAIGDNLNASMSLINSLASIPPAQIDVLIQLDMLTVEQADLIKEIVGDAQAKDPEEGYDESDIASDDDGDSDDGDSADRASGSAPDDGAGPESTATDGGTSGRRSKRARSARGDDGGADDSGPSPKARRSRTKPPSTSEQ